MNMDESGGHVGEPEEGMGEVSHPIPALHVRAAQIFFSPGLVVAGLARSPAWVGALLVGAALVLLQMALIPVEVWEVSLRNMVLESGQPMPAIAGAGASFMRFAAMGGGTLMYFVMAFLFAGVVTFVFAFLLGDEGKYRQYLAVMVHAWLIPSAIGLALVPLRIAQEDPQFVLSLGAFFSFLPDGYLLRVANLVDLSQIWGWLVVAQGVHAIDPRRSFAAAAGVLITLSVGVSMLVALLPGMG